MLTSRNARSALLNALGTFCFFLHRHRARRNKKGSFCAKAGCAADMVQMLANTEKRSKRAARLSEGKAL